MNTEKVGERIFTDGAETKDITQENGYNITEMICRDCGKHFILRAYDFERYALRGWSTPKRCIACRKKRSEDREAERKAIEDAKWKRIKAEAQAEFERRLASWNTISYTDIRVIPDKTLYIIGNGFDMMHGVNSSYYGFRDFLGKNSSLRQSLEEFTTVDDLWADFENALAHIDMSFFYSRLNIDNWLYITGAYEKDAGAAEFYMAAEDAVGAVTGIVGDLQRRVYEWVSQLAVGTYDRPLKDFFRLNCKVLSFNYTEFAETMYGVPHRDICYIHGFRVKEKGKRRPELILGHAPNASDEEFNKPDHTHVDMRDRYRREMIYSAQEVALDHLIDSDTKITKDCERIIAEHSDFFDSIENAERIVTIGHSLSEVDWPYFRETISRLHNPSAVEWFIGCHGLRDLENLEKLIHALNLNKAQIWVFRTDVIHVKRESAPESVVNQSSHPKLRCKSADERWLIQTLNRNIQIINNETGENIYEVEFPGAISNIFFLGEKLILVSNDYPSGIFVFGKRDDYWIFLFELENKDNTGLIKRSLNRILLDEGSLVFVYNNRVRIHSLENGRMMHTAHIKGARDRAYPGENVTGLFVRRR